MTTLEILAIIFGIIGIIGSIIPAIPGPPLSWVGILFVYLNKSGMTSQCLWILFAVMVVVTILDFVLPSVFTKISSPPKLHVPQSSKYASLGAIAGLFLGLLFPIIPLGMIGGSMMCAFLFELLGADRSVGASFKAAIFAFLSFMLTTGLKLIVSGVMLYYIVVNISR